MSKQRSSPQNKQATHTLEFDKVINKRGGGANIENCSSHTMMATKQTYDDTP